MSLLTCYKSQLLHDGYESAAKSVSDIIQIPLPPAASNALKDIVLESAQCMLSSYCTAV